MEINGKKVATKLKNSLKKEIETLDKKPGLAVILVGNDQASKIYVNLKVKACMELGIQSFKHVLPNETTEKELLNLIDKLNNDNTINGILVQMPLPKQISRNAIVAAVNPNKDVDGFHPINTGRLVLKQPCLKACTPRGIMKLFQYYNIDLKGKEVVVIGRSIIVGTPVALMCQNENATVTVCHSKTKDLSFHTKRADVIISAVGKANLVTPDMVKDNVIIIDVGMNRVNGKLCGDIDYENIKDKCSFITPVPGGVGPMTIATLMDNTLLAYKIQNNIPW